MRKKKNKKRVTYSTRKLEIDRCHGLLDANGVKRFDDDGQIDLFERILLMIVPYAEIDRAQLEATIGARPSLSLGSARSRALREKMRRCHVLIDNIGIGINRTGVNDVKLNLYGRVRALCTAHTNRVKAQVNDD